jgi:hypothetical protein
MIDVQNGGGGETLGSQNLLQPPWSSTRILYTMQFVVASVLYSIRIRCCAQSSLYVPIFPSMDAKPGDPHHEDKSERASQRCDYLV